MTTRPYRLHGASGRRRIEQRIETALARWSQKWWAGVPTFRVEAEVATDDVRFGAATPLCRAAPAGWVGWLDWCAVERGLAAALFPGWDSAVADPPGEMTAMVLRQAGIAVLEEITGAFPEGAVEAGWPEPLDLGPGSGAVRVRLPDLNDVSLLLSGDLLEAWRKAEERQAQQAPALAGTLIEAVSSRQVCLTAYLGSAELSLAELATMAPGDVIQLDSARTAPIELRNTGGRTVCKGYLGARDEWRALRIISS